MDFVASGFRGFAVQYVSGFSLRFTSLDQSKKAKANQIKLDNCFTGARNRAEPLPRSLLSRGARAKKMRARKREKSLQMTKSLMTV